MHDMTVLHHRLDFKGTSLAPDRSPNRYLINHRVKKLSYRHRLDKQKDVSSQTRFFEEMAIPFSTPRNHEIWGDAQIVESPLKLSWRRSLSKSTTTRYSKEEVRINMASEKADRPDLQLGFSHVFEMLIYRPRK